MAKYTYNNEPISEDFVTEAAEVGGLNIEEYITSKDGLEVVDESIVKNSPTSLDADVEVTAASVTNGESPQANGSSVSPDPDPKKKRPDNSKEAILKRKAERRKRNKEDEILDSIRMSVDENGDFINAEALDEVVVYGEGRAMETEIADTLGWTLFAPNTVEGRLSQQKALIPYIQGKPGFEIAELDNFNARLNEKNTPGQTGLGPTGNQINTFLTGGNDFREDENTWKGNTFGEVFGGSNSVEKDYPLEGNKGLVLDYSGLGIDTDANLISSSIPASRRIFVNQKTTLELENQLKRKPLFRLVDETIEKGKDFLNESDNELIKLQTKYDSLSEGSAEKLKVAEEINNLVEDENYGGKLYDPFTQKLYDFKQAPQEVLNIYGKAKKIAQNTPLTDLKNSLNKSYYKVVALAKGIENYSKDELEAAVPGIQNIAGGVANFFGSTTTLEADYNFINEIAQKEYIPKQITKLPGKHPFALEFNKALEDYIVLNRAYQVNRNPITSEKEDFAMATWDSVVERSGATSMVTGVTSKQKEVQAFSDVMQANGLVDLKPDVLSERLSLSIPQMVGGGIVDLSLFAGEIFATRKLSFNSFKKGTDAVQKMVEATSAYKKSALLRGSTPIILKGFDEAGTFVASSYVMGRDPSFEENMATAKFAFFLGTGQGGAALLLRKMPVNTFMSPITAQLAKARTTKNWIPSATGAGVGAFSFEFASAITSLELLGGDGEYFKQTPQEMLYHFLGEYGKMRLLGAKSIFSSNGMIRAARNDIREMAGMSTVEVRDAGKAVGWNDFDRIKEPDLFTTEDLAQQKGQKIEDVNKKIQDGKTTKEEGLKEINQLESNYKVLEAQAELNIAKEIIKEEDKSDLQPKDSEIYVALERLKLGQELNARDNYVLANTPVALLLNRFGGDAVATSKPTLDYLRSISQRSQIIEQILDENYELKTRSGTKLREQSFKFVFDSMDVGEKMMNLDRKKDKTDLEESELKELRKEYERYQPKGDLYENITSKIKENRFKVYDENLTESQDFVDAGKEGTITEVETAKGFQEKYNETVGGGKNVEKSQGFFDPSTNTMYINKARNIETGETSTAKHEVDHFALRNSLKNEDGLVTEQGIEIIDDVISRLTPKQKSIVEDRINSVYKFNEDGTEKNKNEYYEEYLTVLSESIRNKEIQFSENFGFGLTKLIPLLGRKVEMNTETGENLFNMITDFAGGGKQGAEAMQKLSQEAEGKKVGSKVVESRTEDVERLREGIKEGLYTNESLIDVINSKSSKDKFAAIDVIIEENWPVISKALSFNPTGQISMDNIKEAVREQMQGIFPNKGGSLKPEFFKDYIPPGKTGINKAGDIVEGTKVTTFLNRFRDRTPEILERAKALQAGETKLEGESLDSEQAMQVAAPKPASLKPAVEPTLDVFSIVKKIKGKGNSVEDAKAFEKTFTTAVEALAKEKGVDITKENLTPKEIKQITPYEVLANEIGIPVNKLTNPRDNLSKPESMKAQQLLLDSRTYIKNVVLGQANREVTTETKKSGLQVKRGGESLGLGTKLVERFFNEKKRVGNNYVRTPKLFDIKVFDAAIGTKEGKVQEDYVPQSTESQIIKSLLKAVAEQMTTRSAVNVIDAKEGKGKIAQQMQPLHLEVIFKEVKIQ